MTPSREPGRDRPRREHCRLRTIVLLVMCAGHLTAAAESAPWSTSTRPSWRSTRGSTGHSTFRSPSPPDTASDPSGPPHLQLRARRPFAGRGHRRGPGARAQVTFYAGELAGEIGSEFTIIGDEDGHEAHVHCELEAHVSEHLLWPRGRLIDLGDRPARHPARPRPVILRRGPTPATSMRSLPRWSAARILLVAAVAAVTRIPGHRVHREADPRQRSHDRAPGCLLQRGGAHLGPHQPSAPVRWTVPGPWEAKPAGALFGVVPVDGEAHKTLQLRARSGTARAQVVRIVSSDPERATCQLLEEDGTQHLETRFTGASPIAPAPGHFDVTFTDGGILRIPFYATVGPASGRASEAAPAVAAPSGF